MNWLTDELFLALKSLFGRFGTPIVFVAALAEATVGVGVVFPGVVLMFLAGAYKADEGGHLALVLLVAILGTLLGDTLSYWLGRWGGRRLAGTRLGPALRLGEALISGRTRWLIPFYHLQSVTRAIGPFGAGALHLPLRVWMPLDYLGAVLSNFLWIGAGAVFGRALLTERGTLEQHPALRIGLAVGAMAWFLLARRTILRRAREMREDRTAVAADDPPER